MRVSYRPNDGRPLAPNEYPAFGGAMIGQEHDDGTKFVRLLVDKTYPANWVFSFEPIRAGTVVPVVPATNQPTNGFGDPILYWVNTPELRDDAYGIGLYAGEFEEVAP